VATAAIRDFPLTVVVKVRVVLTMDLDQYESDDVLRILVQTLRVVEMVQVLLVTLKHPWLSGTIATLLTFLQNLHPLRWMVLVLDSPEGRCPHVSLRLNYILLPVSVYYSYLLITADT